MNGQIPAGFMHLACEATHMARHTEGKNAILLEKVALGAMIAVGVVSTIHVVKELLRALDRPAHEHGKGR